MSEQGRLRTEIVTSGTEILLGEIVDTNAAWIAQQLRDAGINLYYKTTVGDNEARLSMILQASLERSDVILVTGGLGPTADDVTRQAIAHATAAPLRLHDGALETLKARFARFGVEMTDNNIRQAYIPEGAILVENPVGTAPGFIVERDQGTVIAMPGVPSEMKTMMTQTVLPYLRRRNGNTGVIVRRVLRTIGIGESAVDHQLAELMDGENPTVGLAAHIGQVDIRITAGAESEAEAAALLDELEALIESRVGDFIYSREPKQSLADVVSALVSARQARVAVVERAEEGGVGATLVAHGVPAITWTFDALPAPWTTSLPAVSEAGARQLAETALGESGADYAMVILATQDPNSGVFGSQPGESFIGVAQVAGVHCVRIPYAGTDANSITRISKSALAALWRVLRSEA